MLEILRPHDQVWLFWITKAFNLEWLLNLWERVKPSRPRVAHIRAGPDLCHLPTSKTQGWLPGECINRKFQCFSLSNGSSCELTVILCRRQLFAIFSCYCFWAVPHKCSPASRLYCDASLGSLIHLSEGFSPTPFVCAAWSQRSPLCMQKVC